MRQKLTILMAFVFMLTLGSIKTAVGQDIGGFTGPVVYDQSGTLYSSGLGSTEKFNSNDPAYFNGSAAADDFVVPSNKTWKISSVFAQGSTNGYSSIDQLTGISVTIFNDIARKPGDTLYHYFNLSSFIYNETSGEILVSLGEELSLPAGPYWISVQAISDYNDWTDYYWRWHYLEDYQTAVIGELPQKKEYYSNTSPKEWKPATTSASYKYNLAYSLHTSFSSDLAIAMVSPTNSMPNMGATEIGVKVYNLGTTDASNFAISYSVNGGDFVSETITETVAASSSKVFAFSTMADLSAVGLNEITTVVTLSGDEKVANDTSRTHIENYGKVFTLDADLDGTTVTGCDGRFTDAGGIDGKTEGIEENYTVTFKPTAATDRAQLEFADVVLMEAGWFGDTYFGTLTVFDGEDVSAPVLGEVSSLITATDKPEVFVATNAAGALTVQYVGLPWTGSIDGWIANISCYTPPANDLEMVSVLSPNYSADFTATEVLTVAIKNLGGAAQTEVPVSYVFNTNDTVTETIASIAVGEVYEHTFTNTFDLTSLGAYTFNVWVDVTDDATPENNMISKTISNYAEVYTIDADTINADTLMVCSGVLTDEGGLNGPAVTENFWGLGRSFSTKLFPPDSDHRMQIEIDMWAMGDGGFGITDDSVANYDKQMYLKSSMNPEGMKFLATNPSGRLMIDYGGPTIGTWDGIALNLMCVPILDVDMHLANINLSRGIINVNDEVMVSADLTNIGKLNTTATLALVVDGVGMDTMMVNLDKNAVSTIEFMWIADATGQREIALELVDDAGDMDYNVVAVSTMVFDYMQMAETFDMGMPLNWEAKQNKWRVQTINNDAYHAAGYVSTSNIDSLFTSMVQIEEGDKLSFYARSYQPGIWGAAGSVGHPDFSIGWYNMETNSIELFDFNEKLNIDWTGYEIDLSAAVGITKLVFINGIDYEPVDIDYMVGPKYVGEGSQVALTDYAMPTLAQAGVPTEISVTLTNSGAAVAAGAYTIDLYNLGDETPLMQYEGAELNPLKSRTQKLYYTIGQEVGYNLYAVLNYDGNSEMNMLSTDTVYVAVTAYSTVTTEYVAETWSGKNYPMATNKKFSIAEMLYTEKMVGAQGMLKGLAFKQKQGIQDTTHVKIWVGQTDSIGLDNGFVTADKLTLVYDNNLVLHSGAREALINFDTDYNYAGGNLAVLVYQNGDGLGSHDFYYDYALGQYDSNSPDYVRNFAGADTIDAAGIVIDTLASSSTYYGVHTWFMFDEATTATATVKDGAGVALENVKAEMMVDGTTLYTAMSDNTGAVSFTGIAIASYDVKFSLAGYESYVMENVAITGDANDLGAVTIAAILNPVGLTTVVDNAAKTATSTWNTTKAFAHYNVYLDGEMVMDSVEATSYVFTELTDGMHVAGVTSVYNGGMSEMVVDTFHVVYAPVNLTAKLYSGEFAARATWEFEGTSADFYAFQVSLNGTVIDTAMTNEYEFTNLVAGVNTITISSIYTIAGLASAEVSVVIAVAPTNLVVTPDAGAHTAVATWTGSADSYNVYVNGVMTANVTETTYTLTDLMDGYYVVAVSGLFGDVESDKTSADFVFVNVTEADATGLAIYPNPANNWIMISGTPNTVVEIRDIAGKLMVTQEMISGNERIDVSELYNGIYVVSMINENGLVSKRLIIE